MSYTPARWAEYAQCRPGYDSDIDPEDFFPVSLGQVVDIDPDTGQSITAEERAKGHCSICPVRAECLRHALVTGDVKYGIRGGKTAEERYAMARRERRREKAWA